MYPYSIDRLKLIYMPNIGSNVQLKLDNLEASTINFQRKHGEKNMNAKNWYM